MPRKSCWKLHQIGEPIPTSLSETEKKWHTVSIETKTFVDIQCEYMFIFGDEVSQNFII